MNGHIGHCSILLQLSPTEGMSRVFVDAMSAGKPVISTEIDGVPNVIENGRNGILVPPGDVGRTADALKLLMRNPAIRASLGQAGFAKANSTFQDPYIFSEAQ